MKLTSRWGPKIMINFSNINNKATLRASREAFVFDNKPVNETSINLKKIIYIEEYHRLNK